MMKKKIVSLALALMVVASNFTYATTTMAAPSSTAEENAHSNAGTVEKKEKKTVKVSEKAATKAIEKAKKTVSLKGAETTKLNKKVVMALEKAGKSVKITSKKATVTLDSTAVKSLGGKSAALTVKTGKKSFTVSLKDSKGKVVKGFKGTAMVKVKLKLKKGQKLFMGKKLVKFTQKDGYVFVTLTKLGKITVK